MDQKPAARHGQISTSLLCKSTLNARLFSIYGLAVNSIYSYRYLSVLYFCKLFRKAKGLTFTEYLAQVQALKARNRPQPPRFRIPEVAFEAGFQCIAHFDRASRKLPGESPTAFQSQVWATEATDWIRTGLF